MECPKRTTGVQRLKILLIEDQVIFRNGLKSVLACLATHIEFTEVNNCENALACLTNQTFDLVITELFLPDSSGIATLNQLRNKITATPIVVLCGEESPQIMRAAISQGASGFIPKSSSDSFLLSVIQFVNSGGIYLPPNTLDGWGQSADSRNQEVSVQNVFPEVSKRQSEVLENVVQGKPNKVIAREMNISEGTVKSHLSQLFRALGVKNRTEAVYASRNRRKRTK